MTTLEHTELDMYEEFAFYAKPKRTAGIIHPDRQDDLDFVYRAMKEVDAIAFAYASPRLRDTTTLAILAVSKRPSLLSVVSDRLRHAPCVVDAAIRTDARLTRELVKTVNVDGTAMHNFGALLCYATDAFKADKDVVLRAVTQYGPSLAHASVEMRDDAEIVATAVASDGEALQYASERLRADAQVVFKAVKNCGLALRFAAPSLVCSNLPLVHAAIARDGMVLAEVVRMASSESTFISQVHASFLYEAVQSNGHALSLLSPDKRSDLEWVLTAATSRGMAVQHALSPARFTIYFGYALHNMEFAAWAAMYAGCRAYPK